MPQDVEAILTPITRRREEGEGLHAGHKQSRIVCQVKELALSSHLDYVGVPRRNDWRTSPKDGSPKITCLAPGR
jgi:hypothetical protein